jgi:integrase
MGKLTVATAKALRHDPAKGERPVRFGDGDGLYLQIAPGSRGDVKSWLFRFKLHGKEREMGLGPFGELPDGVPLAEARKRAAAARAFLAEGIDPIDARSTKREEAKRKQAAGTGQTFEAAARALADAKRPGWRSPKHAAQWLATLEQHAFPIIGTKPVASIGTEDVLAVLRPIWQRTPETASRLRQRIEAVLDDARVKGLRPEQLANPARWKGHLSVTLPSPRKVRAVEHQPSLAWQQMAAFMAALEQRQGMAGKALRFAILTASRTGAVRLMQWREIDLAECVWTAPAVNMKTKKPHRTPLSEPAMRLLQEVRPLMKAPTDLVFPGARAGRPLSDMALSMLVRGMACDGLAEHEPPRWRDIEGRPVVPHGFRTTFKGWSLAAGHPDTLSELALAHADTNKVRAAYAREDMLEQRRPMMDAWAAHCFPQGSSPDMVTPAEARPAAAKSRTGKGGSVHGHTKQANQGRSPRPARSHRPAS